MDPVKANLKIAKPNNMFFLFWNEGFLGRIDYIRTKH
jgi:hypothetical protein